MEYNQKGLESKAHTLKVDMFMHLLRESSWGTHEIIIVVI